jgi:hypothetical protein
VTANGVSGSVMFADADSSHLEATTVTPDGSDYAGSFSISQATASDSGGVSVAFEFMKDNDQIYPAANETLTQSYAVNLNEAHNAGASQSQTVAVSIGGPGADNFVFTPGVGADTILNFNPQLDTIELDHFNNAQTIQELQSLITNDAHGDASIGLSTHDSITVAGMTAAQLQANLQNLIHLH